jgi:hypothetical protein
VKEPAQDLEFGLCTSLDGLEVRLATKPVQTKRSLAHR